jgi:hypothetical protein
MGKLKINNGWIVILVQMGRLSLDRAPCKSGAFKEICRE